MSQTRETADRVRRKLTTIFCADVAGYSRLMDADEAGTMDRLRQYRLAMRGLIKRHDGRVVNTWGDAVIAEFASPVEAVQAAVEVQHELAARNDGVPDDRAMRFRIGVNLGDVMVEGDDLYGEGVNIAARLQALADPGGIVISGTVHDLVYKKLGIGFEFIGAQSVKNIADSVPTYKLVLDGDPHPAPNPTAKPARARQRTTCGPMRQQEPSSGPDRPSGSPCRPMPMPGSISDEAVSRFRSLPRRGRFALSMIAFFFLINLFTGMGDIWFQWPSIPFLLILFWSLAGHRSGKHHADRN